MTLVIPALLANKFRCRPDCACESRHPHGQMQHIAAGGRIIDIDHRAMPFEARRLLDQMADAAGTRRHRRGPTSWSGPDRKIDDVAAALHFKPAKHLHRAPDTTGEGRVFHRPANLDVAALVGEVEDFAPDFDARYVLAKVNGSRRKAVFHAHATPPPLHTEQQGIEAETASTGKLVNAVIDGLTSFVRQSDELSWGVNCEASRSGAVSSMLPHEADAA